MSYQRQAAIHLQHRHKKVLIVKDRWEFSVTGFQE